MKKVDSSVIKFTVAKIFTFGSTPLVEERYDGNLEYEELLTKINNSSHIIQGLAYGLCKPVAGWVNNGNRVHVTQTNPQGDNYPSDSETDSDPNDHLKVIYYPCKIFYFYCYPANKALKAFDTAIDVVNNAADTNNVYEGSIDMLNKGADICEDVISDINYLKNSNNILFFEMKPLGQIAENFRECINYIDTLLSSIAIENPDTKATKN
ncbi:hypothetical protein COEREDRAFT_87896 [Coemansia reversa NRRL 1564]|uniref:Uncharacterized protein n=1 Tax=Coemansia reversa (strain ATCC 12441 / NRRL 1564) TaxID=763665 RepID=A0A2G5B8Z7_COERN|nr:hypothetical protein COEREDRAFT_87896 [Coemansia reversa NRRL 1564]|eukprot:PIA15489.1 hypothetical protein COEREDRAFT_87896 [Coemansia reversa NRRL 1564]